MGTPRKAGRERESATKEEAVKKKNGRARLERGEKKRGGSEAKN